jgi:hypothetical protein
MIEDKGRQNGRAPDNERSEQNVQEPNRRDGQHNKSNNTEIGYAHYDST